MSIAPELRELLLDGITPEHLAVSERVALADVLAWSPEERAAKRDALIEKVGAFAALEEAHSVVLRYLYGLPDGVDIDAYIERNDAPEKLRQERRDFTESDEARFFHALMRDITIASPRRAVGFLMATKERAE